jgi:hypothetical protein
MPAQHQLKPIYIGTVFFEGVLGQAKNGEELFWEEKLHTTNGKAQTCTQGDLPFFLLSLGGGGRIFLNVSLVLNVFSLCSFQVPNGFSSGSPTCSP